MPDQAHQILLGDTHPESRVVLKAICQEQGWRFTAVESSPEVLQVLRDEPGISLVMVDPTLPGPGRDVVHAIKTSAQLSSMPVMFVLHEDVQAPTGIQVDGSIEIDHAGPARVLAAMREAISGAASARPADARHVEEHPHVHATPAAPTAAVVRPAPMASRPGARRARILVADAVAETRTILEPLCERHGWELVAIESGFQVLRVVRDTNIDLVLINPYLQAAGVSGIDIARTIKAAAQFRKVPVLFLLHQGNAVPAGVKVDGTVEVDAWPDARLESALSAALGRAVAAVDTAPLRAPLGHADTDGLPTDERLAQLREDLLAEVRRTVEAGAKAFSRTEDRDTTARLDRLEQAVADMKAAIEAARPGAEGTRGTAAPGLEPAAVREAMEAAVRQYLAEEGRPVLEQIAAAVVPTLAERLVQQQLERLPSPAAKLDELLPRIQEQILQEARSQVERSVAALTQEIVPTLAERLVQQQLERLPGPAAKLDELLPQIQEEALREVRRVADAVTRQQIDVIGASIRDSLATYIDDAVRAVAREIVPTVAERLINSEIARLRKDHQLD